MHMIIFYYCMGYVVSFIISLFSELSCLWLIIFVLLGHRSLRLKCSGGVLCNMGTLLSCTRLSFLCRLSRTFCSKMGTYEPVLLGQHKWDISVTQQYTPYGRVVFQ